MEDEIRENGKVIKIVSGRSRSHGLPGRVLYRGNGGGFRGGSFLGRLEVEGRRGEVRGNIF